MYVTKADRVGQDKVKLKKKKLSNRFSLTDLQTKFS